MENGLPAEVLDMGEVVAIAYPDCCGSRFIIQLFLVLFV
jgi:hypothetical protein